MKVFSEDKILKSASMIGVHVQIDSSGHFSLNGFKIPRDKELWLFEKFGNCLGMQIASVPVVNTKKEYFLWAEGEKYSLTLFNEGGYELRKNEKLHSLTGPAKKTKDGREFYIQDDLFHRLDGPIVTGPNHEDIYALDGKIHDIFGFIENHPEAKISNVFHKGQLISKYRYNDMMVIKVAGHNLLLSRNFGLNNRNPADFITAFFYKELPTYDLIKIKTSNETLTRIYDLLKESVGEMVFDNYGNVKDISVMTVNREWLNVSSTEDLLEYSLLSTPDDIRDLGGELLESGEVQIWREISLRDWEETMIRGPKQNELDSLIEELMKLESNPTLITKEETVSIDSILEELGAINKKSTTKKVAATAPSAKRTEETIEVFGIPISEKAYAEAMFDPKTESYYWTNMSNDYHSFNDETPARIFANGRYEFYKDGFLHNENGPAVGIIGNGTLNNRGAKGECHLHGKEVTPQELARYRASSRTIEFRKDGQLHRTDGPAFTQFFIDGTYSEYWFENGTPTFKEEDKESESFADVPRFEKETKGVKKMEKERGEPDMSGGRLDQVWQGGRHGFKKGVVNGSSTVLANKIVSMTPFDDSEWAAKFFKLAIIAGFAEIVDIIPDGAAERVSLDYETQREISGFLRKVAGENLGRDAVSLLAGLVPFFANVLNNFTAKEVNEATAEYEASPSLETAEHKVTLEELLANSMNHDLEAEQSEEVEEAVQYGK